MFLMFLNIEKNKKHFNFNQTHASHRSKKTIAEKQRSQINFQVTLVGTALAIQENMRVRVSSLGVRR